MNKIDQAIQTNARALFIKQGWDLRVVDFKVKELQICIDRGYNTRATIWSLIKLSGEKK